MLSTGSVRVWTLTPGSCFWSKTLSARSHALRGNVPSLRCMSPHPRGTVGAREISIQCLVLDSRIRGNDFATNSTELPEDVQWDADRRLIAQEPLGLREQQSSSHTARSRSRACSLSSHRKEIALLSSPFPRGKGRTGTSGNAASS
jgi:hypothetical protein